MRFLYGVETTLEELNGKTPYDQDDNFLIYQRTEKLLDTDTELDIIGLIETSPIRISDLFYDYGFISTRKKYYVYEEMTSFFTISKGDVMEVTMFLQQLEEELIAVVSGQNKKIYVIDKQLKMLIEKWAEAYRVSVEFILG